MIGERAGEYTLKAQIGEGAMGIVYLAHHRHLDQPAAIKVLSPGFSADARSVRRFMDEARAAARIHHRGVVQIFDCSVLDNGQPYIVMELLEGETLAAYLAQRRLATLDAAVSMAGRLGGELASGLAAAHAKRVIHRDLKPENIFLARDPDGGGVTVKILDFGVAKLIQEGSGVEGITRPGTLLGTPAYMSPEQCCGQIDIDQRADIYSLGCVLYEVVSGRPPFVRKTLGDLIVAHATEQPAPLAALGYPVSATFQSLLGRMLQKDPAQRPADVGEVKGALEALTPRGCPSLGEMLYSNPRRTGRRGYTTAGGGRAEVAAVPADVEQTLPLTSEPRRSRTSTLSSTTGEIEASASPPPASLSLPGRLRPRSLALVSLPSALLVLGVALYATSRSRPSSPPERATEPQAAIQHEPASAARPPPGLALPAAAAPHRTAPAAAPPAVAPPVISVAVTSRPGGAEIWIPGESKARCEAPCTVTVARSDGLLALIARRPGYRDTVQTLRADRDHRIDFHLDDGPRPGPAAGRAASAPAAARSRAAAAGLAAPAARPSTEAPAATGNDDLLPGTLDAGSKRKRGPRAVPQKRPAADTADEPYRLVDD
jgi:serine/threonine-protein kinase